jgi:hypothetical protein
LPGNEPLPRNRERGGCGLPAGIFRLHPETIGGPRPNLSAFVSCG